MMPPLVVGTRQGVPGVLLMDLLRQLRQFLVQVGLTQVLSKLRSGTELLGQTLQLVEGLFKQWQIRFTSTQAPLA